LQNNKSKTIVAAAIQLNTRIGDNEHNLKASERLANEAVKAGATWIALPEFFNTGMCWDPELVHAIEYDDDQTASFLQKFSQKKGVVVGGSFMCRVPEGGVRNRYLCFDSGKLVGKHDKDLPTMWENAFYEGGDKSDTGILGDVDGQRVGSAMCWEFIRTQTAKRMKGKVDVVMGGSYWWSMPTNWPKWMVEKTESYNRDNLLRCIQKTALLIGAPVIHGSHCNTFACKMPGIPYPFNEFNGEIQGHAMIVDAQGKILAHRDKREGEGFVTAEVTLGSVETTAVIPDRFWLRDRTLLAAFSWHHTGFLTRLWYRQHVKFRDTNMHVDSAAKNNA